MSHQGNSVAPAVDLQSTNKKSLQQSLAAACVGSPSFDGSAYLATNLPSGWMKRLVDDLPALDEGTPYDSKFATLLASCLNSYDARQVFLFEDLFEDVNDGLLCSLSLRHDRSSLGDTILPHNCLISKMKPLSDKLPVGHRYVLPQCFVTSPLIQSLKKVDSMRPGVEVEINSSTEDIARELRPLMQNVKFLTLPHLLLSTVVFTGALWERLVLFYRKTLLLLF